MKILMQWWQQKSRHYSGNNSLNVRVSAAVCQKNMGQLYLCSVFRKAGLQNYTIMQQLVKKFIERAKKRKVKVPTIASKRRQLELTAKRRQKNNNTTLEVREGSTYQSGISLIDTIDLTELFHSLYVYLKRKMFQMVNLLWCPLTLKQPLLENVTKCSYLAKQYIQF